MCVVFEWPMFMSLCSQWAKEDNNWKKWRRGLHCLTRLIIYQTEEFKESVRVHILLFVFFPFFLFCTLPATMTVGSQNQLLLTQIPLAAIRKYFPVWVLMTTVRKSVAVSYNLHSTLNLWKLSPCARTGDMTKLTRRGRAERVNPSQAWEAIRMKNRELVT